MRKEDLFPDLAPTDPAQRIRSCATKIRSLRSQVGHDGLAPSAARTLIDELSTAMEEIAKVLDRPRD
ncbi:MAG: hypothetical protein PVJ76_13515 [Gemmatimonadota bacterium]|jgi:hypothetical protein